MTSVNLGANVSNSFLWWLLFAGLVIGGIVIRIK